MGLYGILGLILGLALVFAPNLVPNIFPRFGKRKIGVEYRKNVGPTWILRLAGVGTIIISLLEIFGIVTVSG